jgi:AraC-like DNA-binding protein
VRKLPELRDDCTSRNRSIDVRDGNGVPWLEATLKFLASESTSDVPGAQTIMARLTDVLFIQILRAYIAQNAEEQPELAEPVSMSRTGFAVRFTQVAGVAPLDYVRKWRMQKAGDLLRQGENNLDEIAGRGRL